VAVIRSGNPVETDWILDESTEGTLGSWKEKDEHDDDVMKQISKGEPKLI